MQSKDEKMVNGSVKVFSSFLKHFTPFNLQRFTKYEF